MNPYYPKRFLTLDSVLKARFGEKTVKIPLNAGMGCPNRDGSCGFGGCSFCTGNLSGEFAGSPMMSLERQFEETKRLYVNKWGKAKYIAYLQAGTNTYAPPKRLFDIYSQLISLDGAVGISIATRADCLSDEVVDVLKIFDKKTYLTVELGLQSSSDKTARLINRGHTYADFLSGYEKLKTACIRTCVHIINGLIGETRSDMMKTACDVASLRPDEVKIHMLYVAKGTLEEKRYASGELKMLSREEYIGIVCDQLERLPPDTAIGRLTGDGDRASLLAPDWSRNKRSVLNGIDMELKRRDSRQGIYFREYE